MLLHVLYTFVPNIDFFLEYIKKIEEHIRVLCNIQSAYCIGRAKAVEHPTMFFEKKYI